MTNQRGSPGLVFGSVTSARSLSRVSSGQLSLRAGAHEEGEDFSDGELLAGGVGGARMEPWRL